MSKKKKNKEDERREDIMPVGHDYRGKEKQIKKNDTTAPDGISGDWT